MTDIRLQIGDRVRYLEGLVSGTRRRGQVGTIANMYSAEGALRADVEFDDGTERGVSIALLDIE